MEEQPSTTKFLSCLVIPQICTANLLVPTCLSVTHKTITGKLCNMTDIIHLLILGNCDWDILINYLNIAQLKVPSKNVNPSLIY